MPVNRLKLMSFAFGAGVAALTGTIFAASQGAVFPVNFDLTLLITVYAMVILGGAGSLTGVALGAIVDQRLARAAARPGQHARALFYGSSSARRPWSPRSSSRNGYRSSRRRRSASGSPRTRSRARFTTRGCQGPQAPGRSGVSWVIVPTQLASWVPPVSYVTLIAAMLALTTAARVGATVAARARRSTSPRSSGRT